MQTSEHPLKVALRNHWPRMSQSKLARLLDMNATQLNKYLSGERQPPDGFWAAAARVLGVDETEIRPPKDEATAA